jgi:two-component system phosphate regulon sensor histidine kinase PhoR
MGSTYSAASMTPAELADVKKNGSIISIERSPLLQTELAYEIIVFKRGLKTYFLRVGLPFSQVENFTDEFKFWFLGFCALSFLFFSMISWLSLHRINFPVRQIIKAIAPYQTGQKEVIPHIALSQSIDKKDDFYKLAETLNSLSNRLRLQIKTLTDERNENEAILESLGEGVIAVDAQMHVLYVNFVAAKMLAIPQRKVLGRGFPKPQESPHAALIEKCRFLLATCQEKLNVVTDSIAVEDGKKIYLDLIAAPKASHNGAILVLQNNSSHYQILEMGKTFVANASHELRTPITIIKGFAETLQDLPELPRDMVVDITEKIVRNCERMDALIKNLLTLADLENLPESRFQECDLVALVESCRQYVLSVYEDAQISIEKGEELVIVAADPAILELAIFNLLDNAAKYSNRPAHITMRIEREGEEVHLLIKDQGIGISPADLEHIYERFYTVDKARSRRLGGSGLGLSIVRTIIEKHRGTIGVTSEVGKGTTFTICLPLSQKPPI